MLQIEWTCDMFEGGWDQGPCHVEHAHMLTFQHASNTDNTIIYLSSKFIQYPMKACVEYTLMQPVWSPPKRKARFLKTSPCQYAARISELWWLPMRRTTTGMILQVGADHGPKPGLSTEKLIPENLWVCLIHVPTHTTKSQCFIRFLMFSIKTAMG